MEMVTVTSQETYSIGIWKRSFVTCGPKVVDADGLRWMIEGKFLPRPVGTWGHGTSSGYFGTNMAKKGMATTTQSLDDVPGRLEGSGHRGNRHSSRLSEYSGAWHRISTTAISPPRCAAPTTTTSPNSRELSMGASNPSLQWHCKILRRQPGKLRRAVKDLGLVGTVVTGTVGQRNLDDPYFEPFFREANELGAAVGVHWITGCFDSPGQERFKEPYFYIHMVGMPFNLMIGIMTLIGGGIMEKYPRDQIRLFGNRRRLASVLDVAHG